MKVFSIKNSDFIGNMGNVINSKDHKMRDT